MRQFLLLLCIASSLVGSAQIPSYVPTDSLIAWYKLTHDAQDYSGLNNHLETVGTPAYIQTGPFGYCDLEGQGSYFYHPDFSFPNYPELTLSCWFRLDAWGTSGHIGNLRPIISKHYSGPDGSFIIYSNSASTLACSPASGITHDWSLSEWHHVTLILTPEHMKVFIDGQLIIAELESDIEFTQYPFEIGGWLVGTPGFTTSFDYGLTLDGGIHSVGIWNRGLSDDEAAQLFQTEPISPGCIDPSSCNYDAAANIDDDSCIPSGCMDEGACNYNADAQCEGEACDYSCCPGPGCCGEGMHWDADAQTCVITPPSVAPDNECTLLNLQELAEGYQILLAENTQLDSLLADCNGMSTSDQSGPCAGENVVTYHGYDYDIVEIGDQCWFAENLRTPNFSDDTFIPFLDTPDWISASGPVQAHVNGSQSNEGEFGRLYNWYAASDSRNLCPVGWSVPSETNWFHLAEHLGIPCPSTGEFLGSNQGAQLKKVGAWSSGSALDLFGFSAIPSGARYSTGSYNGFNSAAFFWSRSEHSVDEGWSWELGGYDSIRHRGGFKNEGFSVRCVKD